MIITARIVLGFGVGLEGGTVPVYVAETVERRLRGNMVSLYQFAIAFGEVLGYAVAAMFVTVSATCLFRKESERVANNLPGSWQLEIYSWFLSGFLYHHGYWYALHARIASFPHAQGQARRSFQGLEAHPWYRAT